MKKTKTNIAVGVGYCFAVVDSEMVRGVALKPCGLLVEVNNEIYPLYKGVTFEDSQKIDKILDDDTVMERDISHHTQSFHSK